MILIVDDNAGDIELTAIALSATGREIPVRSATDGKAALAMLRNGQELPALILLDLKMPGMSGLDLLRAIRADARLSYLPVVVVTASSLASDKAAAMAAGANDYLQKPFDLDQFSKDLEPILQRWLPN